MNPRQLTGSSTLPLVVAAPPVPEVAAKPPPDLSLPARLRTADRQQFLSPLLIEDLLEPDHPARAVWRFAGGSFSPSCTTAFVPANTWRGDRPSIRQRKPEMEAKKAMATQKKPTNQGGPRVAKD